MRRIAGLAATLVLAAAPAAAASPNLVQTFIHLCGDTRGDADQAAARADAAGWKTPNVSLSALAAMIPGVASSNLKARGLNAEGHGWVLLAGVIEAQGRTQRSCTVAETNAPDFNVARAAVQAWVGLPPIREKDGQVVFAFIDALHGRAPSPPGYDPLSKAAQAHPLASAVVLSRVMSFQAVTYAPL